MQTEPGKAPLQYVSGNYALIVGDLNEEIIPIGGDRIEGITQKTNDNQAARLIDALINAQQFVVRAVDEERILGKVIHVGTSILGLLPLLLHICVSTEQLIDKAETNANNVQQGRGKDNVRGCETVLHGIERNQDVRSGRDGSVYRIDLKYHNISLTANNYYKKFDREVAMIAQNNAKLTSHLLVQLKDLVHDIQNTLRIAGADENRCEKPKTKSKTMLWWKRASTRTHSESR